MVQKISILIGLFALVMTAVPQPVYAVSVPSFPSCVNPQGTLKVSYDSGVHGVPGMTDEKRGSDKVYQLSGNDQLMQCFCPENGNGIQTNWWKVKGLTEDEIKTLKNEGWIYIADGSAWGLDQDAYLAKNSDYNCKSTSTNTSTSSTTTTSTTTTPVKEVLNLASTGNVKFLYTLVAAGTLSLLGGFFLRYGRSK